MSWLREDGITGIETVILFAIVGILTIAVVPYYNSLTNQAHDAKIKAMYSMLNASVIGASVDSMAVQGYKSVPNPSQLTMKNTVAWFDSKNWFDNKSGKWTYIPTGATIVYNKISQDDYTLLLNL
jgi:type II secretory pathway pseudopilin PulG